MICYWNCRSPRAHYGLITIRYGVLWYVWIHLNCLQDILVSHVWESQLTHMMFDTDLDTHKLVITSNNNKSQLCVISEQSCHQSRYMLLFWCRISSAKCIQKAWLFDHSRNSSGHCSEALSKVYSVTQSKITVWIGSHVGPECSGHSTHVHQLMGMCTYQR